MFLQKHSFSILDKTSDVIPLDEIKELLKKYEIDLEEDINHFIISRDNSNTIIACAGLSNKIIKCVAVEENFRGSSLSLELGSVLINFAASQNIFQLFLFTHPKNKEIFFGWGFFPIVEVSEEVVFMENSKTAISRYTDNLKQYKKTGAHIGAIVMNANPFTYGHLHLVKYAADRCDWVHIFVVQENSSLFNYDERYKLICEGLKNFSNITVHQGSSYIISKSTFPGYFYKDKSIVKRGWAKTDLLIFKHYIAPALEITHRYVGSEPLDVTTNYYNQEMKSILEGDANSSHIKVIEIPRICINSDPISASRVRNLILKKKGFDLKKLLPPTTYQFVIEKFKLEDHEQ